MNTLIRFAFSISLILFFYQCTKTDCSRYCRKLTDQEKQLDPYKQNDTTFFSNALDTFYLKCISKNYSQNYNLYIDHYYSESCDGGRRTYYWEQISNFISNIPFTDSTLLQVSISIRSNYDKDNGTMTFKIFDNDQSDYNEEYAFNTKPDDANKFYGSNQCEISFLMKLT